MLNFTRISRLVCAGLAMNLSPASRPFEPAILRSFSFSLLSSFSSLRFLTAEPFSWPRRISEPLLESNCPSASFQPFKLHHATWQLDYSTLNSSWRIGCCDKILEDLQIGLTLVDFSMIFGGLLKVESLWMRCGWCDDSMTPSVGVKGKWKEGKAGRFRSCRHEIWSLTGFAQIFFSFLFFFFSFFSFSFLFFPSFFFFSFSFWHPPP